MTISRRCLLRSGALALGAVPMLSDLTAGAMGSPRAAAGKPSPVRLGMCSYTFRNFNRAEMIGYLKQLNIQALNVKDAHDHLPMDPSAGRQALSDYADAGIHLHAAGAIYFDKSDDDDIRNKFEYAKRAGIRVIVAGDPKPDVLPRLEAYAKQYDLLIAIHNHGPEDKIFPSPFDVLKAVHGMDERMGCCIDVGHTVRAGTDVVEAIHAAGPRLHNMHMKDLTSFDKKESQVAVGEGRMPVREIFEALIAVRYPGWVDLEYEVHGDAPMPGATASFSYMRGVLAGMGFDPYAIS